MRFHERNYLLVSLALLSKKFVCWSQNTNKRATEVKSVEKKNSKTELRNKSKLPPSRSSFDDCHGTRGLIVGLWFARKCKFFVFLEFLSYSFLLLVLRFNKTFLRIFSLLIFTPFLKQILALNIPSRQLHVQSWQ